MADWATNHEKLEDYKSIVVSKDHSMSERMNAVFHLRTINSADTHGPLIAALLDKTNSCLIRHELAFVLGQMQCESSIPHLISILQDTNDDAIVRHECAEALGAIGKEDYLNILEEFCRDDAPEVSETCQIAVDRIKWKKEENEEQDLPKSAYLTIDPAPADDCDVVDTLRETLLNSNLPLFIRYRAMFGLRNINSEASVQALAEAFSDRSALLRHEVAYIMGQMVNPASTTSLTQVLRNLEEHPMVRHEAAEALGSIGTEECLSILMEFRDDHEQVVRESCFVALGISDYWKENV